MKSFSIVIPIFNEDENIENLFKEFLNCKIYDEANEIIFVDDCSTDNSSKIINGLANNYNKVKLLSHKINYGQSYCLKTAAQNSNSDLIVTIDGDGQNDPFDIKKLLKIYLKNNYELVGGIRKKRKDSLSKKIASRIANKIRNFILKDGCEDTGCSLKVFDREKFLEFPFFNGIHRFLPYMFKKYGSETYFTNVNHRNRLYGKSKYNNFNRLIKGIVDIFRVKFI